MRNTNYEMQNRIFIVNFLSGISFLDHQNEKMIYKNKNEENEPTKCSLPL